MLYKNTKLSYHRYMNFNFINVHDKILLTLRVPINYCSDKRQVADGENTNCFRVAKRLDLVMRHAC